MPRPAQIVSAARVDVRLIDTAAPGGRCVAANAGVAAADGSEFVVLHDDDDLWDPRFLERTVAWLDAHPEDVGVAVATAIAYEQRIDGAWVETSRVPFWEGMTRVSLTDMLDRNRVVPISLLYRRRVHDEVGGYDERLGTVEDWEFLLRVLGRHSVGFIPGEPLAIWTQRPSATGVASNSMFALEDRHAEDDALVRDRELAAWTSANGMGLPLYLAGWRGGWQITSMRRPTACERRSAQTSIPHQPIASRLRRLRRRLGGPRRLVMAASRSGLRAAWRRVRDVRWPARSSGPRTVCCGGGPSAAPAWWMGSITPHSVDGAAPVTRARSSIMSPAGSDPSALSLNPLFDELVAGRALPEPDRVPALYAYLVSDRRTVSVHPWWDAPADGHRAGALRHLTTSGRAGRARSSRFGSANGRGPCR